MRLLHSLPPYNFAGVDPEFSDYKKARFVVVPVPFDSTVSYQTGSRRGPHAIISASRFIELFDEGKQAFKQGIFTTDELEPCYGDAKKTIGRVNKVVADVIDAKKFPVLLGGEHSISLGAVQAFSERGKDFSLLVLDAHADLWDEKESSVSFHSCVTRYALEQGLNAVVVGARSVSKTENEFIKKNPGKVKVFGVDANPSQVVKSLKKKVYLSIDFDVFDPAEMPAVGTPEPGGMRWREVAALLREVCGKREVIGFDACELMPLPGIEAPDQLAAKLVYKVIGLV